METVLVSTCCNTPVSEICVGNICAITCQGCHNRCHTKEVCEFCLGTGEHIMDSNSDDPKFIKCKCLFENE